MSERREEYEIRKPSSKFRVLLLGPSFAFGWGVNYEETFLERLRVHLAQENSTLFERLDTVNAGVPALGPIARGGLTMLLLMIGSGAVAPATRTLTHGRGTR